MELVLARRRKLTPKAVRAIFKSLESAPQAARQFKVSTQLVYLIRAKRIHKAVTARLKAPMRVARGQKIPRPAFKIDIRALADAIVESLAKRLRAR
jgi:hypothetical protein